MALFNLLDQYGYYAVHHNNKINKLIHIVVLPICIFISFIFINNLTEFECVRQYFEPYTKILYEQIQVRISTLFALALSSYCVYLDTKIGIITAIWIMLTDLMANNKIDNFGLEKATSDGISLLGLSLVLLIIGHLIFEGVTPGLPSEPLAMFIAPLFITMEVLFMFGFLNKKRKEFQCRINSYFYDKEMKKRKTFNIISSVF